RSAPPWDYAADAYNESPPRDRVQVLRSAVPEPGQHADGGFGNLIALPLQRQAREKGNSVFLDQELRPYADQWAFLSLLRRLSMSEITGVLAKAEADMPGGVIGVRLPVMTMAPMSRGSRCRPGDDRRSRRTSRCQIASGSCWLIRSMSTGRGCRR